MKFEIVSVVAFALSVAAFPPSPGKAQGSLSITEAKAKCPGGEIACCQNYEDIEGDGVLGNLLAKGLLNNLLGVGDSACAKTTLIDNLNILGFTTEDDNGVTCVSTTACCSGDSCVAI
ncbi:hypothetical protein UA08_06806 [Talaromyces atroroseus]|uniref:Hydrophobin n=1 Tax=Talaromyces atroroseus TaxID=1441469 RepID=A0A225AAL1_TALAT|nr:hypothetical protein UA08_06806 [Talaromyces atroroseus]OKL58011.1 hypothetical protein UA08_06806 [Talaromyces atroroseus]